MQLVLPRHLRPRHAKIFGVAPSRPRRQHQGPHLGLCGGLQRRESETVPTQGPLTWATLRVLRALLWRFHNADGGGRCFPSYERIAQAAKCARSSVAIAIQALEDAGILTWVNRIARIRRQEVDLFGRLASVWQVVRISNGYRFLDPLERQPGRKAISPKIELDTQNRI